MKGGYERLWHIVDRFATDGQRIAKHKYRATRPTRKADRSRVEIAHPPGVYLLLDSTILTENERQKLGEISSPNAPRVCSCRFMVGMTNLDLVECFGEIPVSRHEEVILADGDPEELQFLIGCVGIAA